MTATTTTTIFSAAGLAAGRGSQAVLSSVDLSIAPGERWALVGRNGSGKTTLLRVMAGLDPPLGGEVCWSGARLPVGAARARAIGVLLQSETPTGFTVREMVTLGLALDGPPSARARHLVDTAVEWAQLGPLAERPCTRLSGGEWQRVLLARALVAAPPLLLLDEPTSHLDPARRAALLAELDRLRGTVAVVLATHDLDCAAGCDRVALLADGALVAVGPPAETLTPPLLERALGVRVHRIEDPDGGAPWLRVLGPA